MLLEEHPRKLPGIRPQRIYRESQTQPCGLAEKLARDGCKVRLCVNGETLAQNLQMYLRTYWAGVLHRLGVKVIPNARLVGADGDIVYFYHNGSGEPILCEGTDTLVLAQGHKSETSLEQALRGMDIDTRLVGDCLSPRTAEEAIYEGYMVARSLTSAPEGQI